MQQYVAVFPGLRFLGGGEGKMCVVGGATCFKKQKKCDNLFDRDFQASSTLVHIKPFT